MNTILVLTDFSEAATNAARYAVELAEQVRAGRVLLYHSSALSYTAIPTTVSGYVPVAEISDRKQDLIALRNELLNVSDRDIQIDILHDDQPLSSAIESVISQQEVSLVVMGATEKGDLAESLFGGNTMTIVNVCTKPILVIPKHVNFQIIRNVLLASDLKNVQKTIPFHDIKAFINLLDAKLFILNVDYQEKNFRTDTILEQTELHKVFDSENSEFRYIDHSDTAEGILSFAETNNVQLIITVKKDHGLFGEIFHRSVSKKLIFETGIPLLVLKQNKML